jgi:hypothetical protein
MKSEEEKEAYREGQMKEQELLRIALEEANMKEEEWK